MNALRLAARAAVTTSCVRTGGPIRAMVVGSQHHFSALAAAKKEGGDVSIRAERNIDFVRDAINKLMVRVEATGKPISTEELESSLAKFARLFHEARECINDCREARAGSLEFYEEAYTAQRAVDQVFSFYADLLDDFRRASDEQLKKLPQDRMELAHALKALRQEVHEVSQPKQTLA